MHIHLVWTLLAYLTLIYTSKMSEEYCLYTLPVEKNIEGNARKLITRKKSHFVKCNESISNNFVSWNIMFCVRSSSMVGILGNVTKTQTALSSTASYADSSDSKVTHLSAYADSLSSYNYQYVRNKTKVRIIYSSWLFHFIQMKCAST
jgi:hypothetical protein